VENKAEADVVRRIFHLYVDRAVSARQIAVTLNEEKIPAPDNIGRAQKNGWSNYTVKYLLENKTYIGIATAGRRPSRSVTAFNRIPKTEKAGVCPVLVDRDTFDLAQEILAVVKERFGKLNQKRNGLLSGFLRCGRCGKCLSKQVWSWSKTVAYGCTAGRALNTGCPQWSVREPVILPAILRKVFSVVDAEILAALDATPKAGPKSHAGLLAAQAEALSAKVVRANRRYLEAEDDGAASGLLEELGKMKKELAEAERALQVARAMEDEGGVKSFAAWWQEQKDSFTCVVESVKRSGDIRAITYTTRETPDPNEPAGPGMYDAEPEAPAVAVAPEPLPEWTDELDRPAPFDRAALRALFQRLGLKVVLKWEKVTKAEKKGNHKWKLADAAIDLDLNWHQEKTSAKQTAPHVTECGND
jgi:hypothetical protein